MIGKMRIQKGKGLRWKIIMTVFISVVFMLMVISVSRWVSVRSMKVVGYSYKSSAWLNMIFDNIEKCEDSLENFVNYYDFENIDIFDVYSKKIRAEIENMPQKPSDDVFVERIYVISQLIDSWLSFSESVILCRVTNSISELKFYNSRRTECYNMLVTQLADFEVMFLNNSSGSYTRNQATIWSFSRLILSYFLISCALILAFIYYMVSEILAPLENISETANLVAQRHFDIPLFNSDSNDEIGNICRAFDSMIISINEYMGTILEKARTETELKEKQNEMERLYSAAKINALQAQISPHFLFNTLNTGVQLAMMEGADKTSEFIEQLAAFFRYNVRPGHETSTIEEELMLTDHFIYIMKVRFGNRLVFEKNVPPEEFMQKMPSMTLQPLVENCIKHGLMNATGAAAGVISLSVEHEPGFVEITICDNGNGIEPEVRDRLLKAAREGGNASGSSSGSSSGSDAAGDGDFSETGSSQARNISTGEHAGIGITNVFSRLKLFFQRDDIFDIQNRPKGGAKFIVRIPDDV